MPESETIDTLCLTHVAATVAAVFGASPPERAEPSLGPVLSLAKDTFDGKKADRLLLYNPDAVALWLFQKYTAFYEGLLRRVQLALPMLSVMPSVTPVCFASMYTGALPEIHGIKTYVKPVVKTDTLFDALLRSGRHPAIVSTAGDSISKIFLERKMDYHIYDTPEECNAKAVSLMREDQNDLIVVYNGDYDAAMHRFSPEGPEALAALRRNLDVFCALADEAKASWKKHNALVAFLPDHGCHAIDGGLGSHGLYMPEDMNIMHFWGAQRAEI